MSSKPTVRAPAAYVAPNAIAFGAIDSQAVVVDAANPLPISIRSFRRSAEVAPSDTQPLGAGIADDMFIGTGGDVRARLAEDGMFVTFRNLASGSQLRMSVSQVSATGTTAQDLVALYYSASASDPMSSAKPLSTAIPLADFSDRGALFSPNAALTDAASTDNPTGAKTALRLATSGSTTYPVASSALLDAPVDVTNGTIVVPFKPVAQIIKEQPMVRFSLELFSSGSPSAPPANYHQMDPFGAGPSAMKEVSTAPDAATPGRWQALGVPSTGFVAVGSGADLSAITWVRLQLRGQTNYSQVIELGSPKFQPNPLDKAKAVLCFDDLYEEIFTVAKPLFDAKGWKFSFNGGALQTNIGQPGRLTLAQCQQLVSEGHHMMLQAWSTEDQAAINAMSDAERAAEMQSQIDYMVANGLMNADAPRFGSYFSGVGSTDIAAYPMFRDYTPQGTRLYSLPHGANPPIWYGETFPWPDPQMVRAIAGDATSPSGFREAHVQQAITNNGVAILTWHSDQSALGHFLDYLATQDIDVVSAKELIMQYDF